MRVRELTSPDSRQLWNDFVASVPTGDILQSWEWGELKARSGWIPTRLLVYDDRDGSETPVAGISILTRRLRDLLRENLSVPGRLPLPRRAICYAPHGPVVRFEDAAAVREILDQAARASEERGGFVLKVEPAIPTPSSPESAQVQTDAAENNGSPGGSAAFDEGAAVAAQLRQHGFTRSDATEGFGGTQPRCVMQLSLEPDLDALLKECKQKTRYNIRLAQKKGVTVREGETPEDLSRFFDVLKVTADRDRFRVRGLEYYQDMWEILRPAGQMKLFVAEHEGDLLSGAILFLFGRWCVYAYGASSNEKRQLMPNYLMQWEMIRWAKEQGFEVYDFRGVSPHRSPDAEDHLGGLNRFKEGFGAQFVEYIGDFDRVLHPGWNLLWNQGMPRLRSVLKRARR